jgi:cation diffusion facilitator family transporter
MTTMATPEPSNRGRRVERVLWVEGFANFAAMLAKLAVGLGTGSIAVLGDAIHSLADLANNALGLVANRIASAPPDREHPYGHRKYETLAVFAVAMLLSVLALEIVHGAVKSGSREVTQQGWSLAVMLAVLVLNVAVSSWESRWAQRLDSDILRADARHTFSDVLTTIGVIAGWQLAARGYRWLDGLASLVIAALILYLAYGLFRRAIPVLVDQSIASPEELSAVAREVDGVRETRQIRSRAGSSGPAIDLVVSVDPKLSTADSHAIADEIERVLSERFAARDVTVHVEPSGTAVEKDDADASSSTV